MRCVNRADDVGGFLGRGTLQDALGHFNHCDLEPAMARHGRCLEPDITATDDQHAATGQHGLSQEVGIALVAHDIYAGELAADPSGKLAWRRAGRQQQSAVVENGATLKHDLFGLAPDLFHPCREMDFDIVIRVPLLRAK